MRPRQARLTDDKTEAQRKEVQSSGEADWVCGMPRETLNNNSIITITTAVQVLDSFPSRVPLDGCADPHNGSARWQCWDSGLHCSRRGDSGAVRGKGRDIFSPSYAASVSVLLGLLFIWTCNKSIYAQG